MEIELRPLSVGEVLDRTFRIYRARFGMFVAIAIVGAAIQIALSALRIVIERQALFHFGRFFATVVNGIGSVVDFFVILIAFALVYAAIARAVMALHLQQPTGIAKAYQDVWPRWFRYMRLSVAAGLLTAWPFLLALVAIIVGADLLFHGKSANSNLLAAEIGGLAILVILAAIPLCIWLLCRYGLCMVSSVVEDLNVRRSLKRSITLSKGVRWRIFLLLVIVYIVQIILAGALMSPIFVVLIHAHGHIPLWAIIYELVVDFIASFLVFPIYGIGLAVIYIDARIRKEGYDIELMMQRTAGEPPAAEIAQQPGDATPFAME